MSFGNFRLSADEQVDQLVAQSREGRIKRIQSVRRQAQLFAADQLQRYKHQLKENKILHRRQKVLEDETTRERRLEFLLKQYGHEMNAIGSAQKEARAAAFRESLSQSEERTVLNVAETKKRQRFQRALLLLRRSDQEKTRHVRNLKEQRRTEIENSRMKAKLYADDCSRHADQQREINQKENSYDRRKKKASIDFRYSRTHQQPYSSVHCSIQRGPFDAAEAAKLETEKFKESHKQICIQKELAGHRARDRGEVALLRERAIIERQIAENKKVVWRASCHRSRRKREVIEVSRSKNTLEETESSFNDAASCYQSLERRDESKVPVPKPPKLYSDIEMKPPVLFRSMEKINAQVQVDLSNDNIYSSNACPQIPEDSETREVSSTYDKQTSARLTPVESSENNKTRQLKKQLRENTTSLSEGIEPTEMSRRGDKLVEVDHSDIPGVISIVRQKGADSLSQDDRSSSGTSPSVEPPQLIQSENTDESGSRTKSDTKTQGIQPREMDLPIQGYEDLTDSLSMDTDQFMMEYFKTFTDPSSDSDIYTANCNTREHFDLDTESSPATYLSTTDAGACSSESTLHLTESDLESSPMSIQSSQTLASEDSSNVDLLIKQLDIISGQSISLLSSVSSLISSHQISVSDSSDSLTLDPIFEESLDSIDAVNE